MIVGLQILSMKTEGRILYGGSTMWRFLKLKSVLNKEEQNFGLVLKVDSSLVKPMTETVEVIFTVGFTVLKIMTK